MADDLVASLDRLKPKQERVIVDEFELQLRAPTLLQYGAFMSAVGAIDPEPLFAAGLPIVMAALDSTDERDVVRAIADNGAAIWRAITGNLGQPAARALAAAAAALLDTERNFKLVVGKEGGLPAGATCDEDEQGGGYAGSPTLRSWIARNVTLEQALHVVERAWHLAKVGEVGKALMAVMRPKPKAEPVNGTPRSEPEIPPAAPSSAAG